VYYLDTSAAIKLLFNEPESQAMRRWVRETEGKVVSSDLLQAELMRATARIDVDKLEDAQAIIRYLFMMRLSTGVYHRAGTLAPTEMRTLDTLHLAAAMELGDDLEGIVTYDVRMARGVESLGIEVIGPT
jgi:predicted nucleic acid-binding protein